MRWRQASEELERIESDRLIAGDRMGAPAAVGAGLAGGTDIKPIESDGRVDQIAALCGPKSYADRRGHFAVVFRD